MRNILRQPKQRPQRILLNDQSSKLHLHYLYKLYCNISINARPDGAMNVNLIQGRLHSPKHKRFQLVFFPIVTFSESELNALLSGTAH